MNTEQTQQLENEVIDDGLINAVMDYADEFDDVSPEEYAVTATWREVTDDEMSEEDFEDDGFVGFSMDDLKDNKDETPKEVFTENDIERIDEVEETVGYTDDTMEKVRLGTDDIRHKVDQITLPEIIRQTADKSPLEIFAAECQRFLAYLRNTDKYRRFIAAIQIGISNGKTVQEIADGLNALDITYRHFGFNYDMLVYLANFDQGIATAVAYGEKTTDISIRMFLNDIEAQMSAQLGKGTLTTDQVKQLMALEYAVDKHKTDTLIALAKARQLEAEANHSDSMIESKIKNNEARASLAEKQAEAINTTSQSTGTAAVSFSVTGSTLCGIQGTNFNSSQASM